MDVGYRESQRAPKVFAREVMRSLGKNSVFGAKVWNRGVRGGVNRQVKIDHDTWVSKSNAGTGLITLGAQPMPPGMKDRVLFLPQNFPYSQEIGYRLLHEATHNFMYLSADSKPVNVLQGVASEVRIADKKAGGGLSALGSLPFYTGEYKAREDVTELMAMYAWDPAYLATFAGFLAETSDAAKAERSRVGLAEINDATALYDMVQDAVEDNL